MSDYIGKEFKPRTNCENCGAPLDEHKDCPYCGTKHQVMSEIIMTAECIILSCG